MLWHFMTRNGILSGLSEAGVLGSLVSKVSFEKEDAPVALALALAQIRESLMETNV